MCCHGERPSGLTGLFQGNCRGIGASCTKEEVAQVPRALVQLHLTVPTPRAPSSPIILVVFFLKPHTPRYSLFLPAAVAYSAAGALSLLVGHSILDGAGTRQILKWEKRIHPTWWSDLATISDRHQETSWKQVLRFYCYWWGGIDDMAASDISTGFFRRWEHQQEGNS